MRSSIQLTQVCIVINHNKFIGVARGFNNKYYFITGSSGSMVMIHVYHLHSRNFFIYLQKYCSMIISAQVLSCIITIRLD